jgi:hypothetical protein
VLCCIAGDEFQAQKSEKVEKSAISCAKQAKIHFGPEVDVNGADCTWESRGWESQTKLCILCLVREAHVGNLEKTS